jgi:hypothetical protein
LQEGLLESPADRTKAAWIAPQQAFCRVLFLKAVLKKDGLGI